MDTFNFEDYLRPDAPVDWDAFLRTDSTSDSPPSFSASTSSHRSAGSSAASSSSNGAPSPPSLLDSLIGAGASSWQDTALIPSFAFPPSADALPPFAQGPTASDPLVLDAQQRILAQLIKSSSQPSEKPYKLKPSLLQPPSSSSKALAADVLGRAGLSPPTQTTAAAATGGKSMPPIAPKGVPPGQAMARNASSSGGSDADSNTGSALTGGSASQPVEKKAQEVSGHNAVEKRYRENINGQIASLRTLVPALRHLSETPTPPHPSMPPHPSPNQLVDGVYPPSKLSKSLILQKSIEYILALQLSRRHLVEDLDRWRAFARTEVVGGDEAVTRWEVERAEVRRLEVERLAKEGLAARQLVASPSSSDIAVVEEDEDERKTRTGASKRKTTVQPSSGRKQVKLESIDPSLLSSSSSRPPRGGQLALGVFAGLAFVTGASVDRFSGPASSSDASSSSAAWDVPTEDRPLVPVVDAVSSPLMTGLAWLGAAFVVWSIFVPLLDRFRPAKATKEGVEAREKKMRRKVAAFRKLVESRRRGAGGSDEIGRGRGTGEGKEMEEVAKGLAEFVDKPEGVLATGWAVGAEVVRLVTGVGASERKGSAVEDAAAWVRLLEIECAPSLPFGPLSTLHTFLHVLAISPSLSVYNPHNPLLSRPRVLALLSIHLLVRPSALPRSVATFLASKLWSKAVSSSLASTKKTDEGTGSVDEEWTRLALSTPFDQVVPSILATAIKRPNVGGGRKAEREGGPTETLPLLMVAERKYEAALLDTWAKIFLAVVRATASTGPRSTDARGAASVSTMTELVVLAGSASGVDEKVVAEAVDMIGRAIQTILTHTVKGTQVRRVAELTAGVWCTAFGDEDGATRAAEGIRKRRGRASRCEKLYLQLVAEEEEDGEGRPVDEGETSEVERLAEASLEWLLLSRHFSTSNATPEPSTAASLQGSAIRLRRLLAHPTFTSTPIVAASVGEAPEKRRQRGEKQREFDLIDAVDLCVESLTVWGRRWAGLAAGAKPGEEDSGYESA